MNTHTWEDRTLLTAGQLSHSPELQIKSVYIPGFCLVYHIHLSAYILYQFSTILHQINWPKKFLELVTLIRTNNTVSSLFIPTTPSVTPQFH